MPKIPVDDVKEGMVLSADVQNMNGQLLIPKGAKIVEKYVTLLRTWGIPLIEVEQADMAEQQNMLTQISEDERQVYEKKLREIFLELGEDDVWMQELFRLCLERKILKTRGLYGS